jgi:iron(III) transport system ATP-binding protein
VGTQSEVSVEAVTHHYESVRAVDDVSLSIAAGEIVCLLGPSGCGKTTLLRLVAGLETLQAGRVVLHGVVVADGSHSIPPERRRVGMLFQDFALFPHLNVGDNVGFGLRHLDKKDRSLRISALLERVQLDNLVGRYPHTLSGGQQQRVALARALAPGPGVVLLDEPFSDLDTRLREEVRDETLAVLKESGAAVLMVTHDPYEAMAMGDQIAVMRRGAILQTGSPNEVYEHPSSPFVAETLGSVNRFSGTVRDGQVGTPLGWITARGTADGEEVLVFVRPEGIALLRDAEVPPSFPTARVEQVRRIGALSVVEILPEGSPPEHTTRSIQFGAASVEVGDIAAVSVDPRHAFVFPRNAASDLILP